MNRGRPLGRAEGEAVMTFSQIAIRLGVSAATVSRDYRRAMAKLQDAPETTILVLMEEGAQQHAGKAA